MSAPDIAYKCQYKLRTGSFRRSHAWPFLSEF